jgi:1-deoxy-D-xylulose-5-phosphate synthase
MRRGVRKFITVEEHVLAGGFGSAVMETLEGENVLVRRIGIGDHFVEHGTQGILRDKEGLSAEKIAEKIRNLFGKELSKQTVRVG